MDRISYIMLKMLPHSLKTRIITLFNKVFNNFIQQRKWHRSAYSILFCKFIQTHIFNKIVANRLQCFVTSNKLLNNRQFGFRN